MYQIELHLLRPRRSEEEEDQAFKTADDKCVALCMLAYRQEPRREQRWTKDDWIKRVKRARNEEDLPPRRGYLNRDENQQARDNSNDNQQDPGTKGFQSVTLAKWDAFKANIKGGLNRFSSRVASKLGGGVGRSGSMPMPKVKGLVPI